MVEQSTTGQVRDQRAPGSHQDRVLTQAARVTLDPATVAALRDGLGEVARLTVAQIMGEVPAYNAPLQGRMGQVIERAVQVSLASFVEIAGDTGGVSSTQIGVGASAARELGRVEARRGRPVDALLAAYRVGARVSWRELSRTAVDAGIDSATLAGFAELVFTYIDELSAASVAGHHAETTSAERARLVALDRLARGILEGQGESTLRRVAAEAQWTPPRTLTVALIDRDRVSAAVGMLDPRTLTVEDDLPGWGTVVPGHAGDGQPAAVLIPDAGGPARARLLSLMTDREAVVGPARPWAVAAESFRRAARALPYGVTDADAALPRLVLEADREAVTDLRARALAPLDDLPEGKSLRLQETLRAWLLLQGRRELVAESLHVHPQTVRYRMGQVRDLFGERLQDPDEVLALILALGLDSIETPDHQAPQDRAPQDRARQDQARQEDDGRATSAAKSSTAAASPSGARRKE